MLYQIIIVDLDFYVQKILEVDHKVINIILGKYDDMYLSGSELTANMIVQKNINNKTSNQLNSDINLIPYDYYIHDKLHYRFLCIGNAEKKQPTGENSYLNLMKNLIYFGDCRKTRNGITYSSFGKTLEFEIKNSFPLFTTKKVFFRGIIEELLFFLNGKTDSKLLEAKGVNIWKANTTTEFIKSRNLNYSEGDMGPMYGFNWLHYGAKYTNCKTNYINQGINQLEYVIKLLKEDPMSRRIIMTTYNPSTAEEGVLYPCHGIAIQFYVNKKGDTYYVSCSMTQRSADVACGIPYNVASYAALTYILCKHLGDNYKPDRLIINLGDVHLYEEHINEALVQINRIPLNFPKLEIKNFERMEELTYDHFMLKDYDSYAALKFVMVP